MNNANEKGSDHKEKGNRTGKAGCIEDRKRQKREECTREKREKKREIGQRGRNKNQKEKAREMRQAKHLAK